MKLHLFKVQTSIVVALIAATATSVSTNTHAAPVDDLRVSQLEQEVRELQHVVQQQARRIETLESVMRQSRVGVTPAPSSPNPVATKSPDVASAWLQSANWDKLRPGSPEADVLQVLGPPATVRKSESGDTQILFYALELEAGGFLSGRVIIAAGRVSEIYKPALK